MKKQLSLAILLLMLSLVAVGCLSGRPIWIELPEGPYPVPSKEWSATFGGPDRDMARSVRHTACGGFIIAGTTDSFGAGESDFWLIKTDSQGNKEWTQTFGGPEEDKAYSVQQTADGGFIIAGFTRSFGTGESDFWLVSTDPQGNKEWSQTFGGPEEDKAYSVQQTDCCGFILAGTTESFGAEESDFWLVKTDLEGNKEWNRSFGGPFFDWASSVRLTTDGGFIVAGTAGTHPRLSPLPTSLPYLRRAFPCVWVIKTDAHGSIQWTQTYGIRPGESDMARSVEQTACGGFIIAGTTDSFGAGGSDVWLIKLAPER